MTIEQRYLDRHRRSAEAYERAGGALSFGRAFRGVERAIRPLLRENALLLSWKASLTFTERVAPMAHTPCTHSPPNFRLNSLASSFEDSQSRETQFSIP